MKGVAHIILSCPSSLPPAIDSNCLPPASTTSPSHTSLPWLGGSSLLLGREKWDTVPHGMVADRAVWSPHPSTHPAPLPLGAGLVLGTLRPASQGCSAIHARSWLGTKGGNVSTQT